jgi:uncharacterized protein
LGRHREEQSDNALMYLILAHMDSGVAGGDNRGMLRQQAIDDFLACKRLAVVGVSRSPVDYTRMVFRELGTRGYDAVPVNPNADEIEGRRVFPKVGEIEPPVEAALLMTPPGATLEALEECAAAGVRRVWIRRASQSAADFCRERGISLIEGHCPMMFLPEASAIHRFHGFLLKISGRYPR